MAQATKAKAKPIPSGYHSIQPQLVFQDASKAIAFYEKAFGAKEVMRVPGPGGRIMHAELQIGDSRVFLMDTMPGMSSPLPSPERPSPASVMLYTPDVDSVFKKAVEAGAKPAMPVDDQFWGDRGGAVIDPFGYSWWIATHVRDVSEAEMRRAAQEMSKKMEAQGPGAHP